MRRGKNRKSGLKLITFMVLIICVVVLYKTKDVKGDVERKNLKIEKLTAKIEEESLRSDLLEKRKAYQSTKRYIEEVARNKLFLYYPEEIIFKEKGD